MLLPFSGAHQPARNWEQVRLQVRELQVGSWDESRHVARCKRPADPETRGCGAPVRAIKSSDSRYYRRSIELLMLLIAFQLHLKRRLRVEIQFTYLFLKPG